MSLGNNQRLVWLALLNQADVVFLFQHIININSLVGMLANALRLQIYTEDIILNNDEEFMPAHSYGNYNLYHSRNAIILEDSSMLSSYDIKNGDVLVLTNLGLTLTNAYIQNRNIPSFIPMHCIPYEQEVKSIPIECRSMF